MTRCCCLSSLCCCCGNTPTTPISISQAKAKAKAKAIEDAKKKHHTLKQLQIYGVLTLQVLASSILMAVTLWLFIRLPEPQVHVTGFAVDGVNETDNKQQTLIHYNITLHNPDLYKSLHYDVLFLRFIYSGYSSKYGATVNFNVDGKGIYQRPGATTLLSNHTVNYTDPNVDWFQEDMVQLRVNKTYIYLRFVMEVRFRALSRVIATRQLMRESSLYFDDNGNAFIDGHSGLILK